MKKQTIFTARFRNVSYYGNPSYYIYVGWQTMGHTAPNAVCAYKLDDGREYTGVLTYHITPKGKTIIEYIDFE